MVVAPSGRKSFALRYRVGGGRGATIREPKIGDWPTMKVERARSIAGDWSAEVRKGGDPGGARKEYRAAPMMEEMFARYLADHARPTKEGASLAEDERLIRDYLSPTFGKRKVAEVSRAEVDKFHKQLSYKPYRANRSLALLSKAFNLAEVWGWRLDASNPCRHVSKFAEKKRKQFLSPKELAALGEALRLAEQDGAIILAANEGIGKKGLRIPVSRYAVVAIRLLVLTGARKSEILGLKWAWMDLRARSGKPPR